MFARVRDLTIGLVAIMALAAVAPAQSRSGELVGTVVPPYPEGLDGGAGSCVGEGVSGEAICEMMIGVIVTTPDREPAHVAAFRATGRDADGKPYTLITDLHPYPAGEAGDELWFECRENGVEDRTIAAVVRWEDEQWLAARWAVRLDRETGLFSKLDPAGVDCLNIAAGEGGPVPGSDLIGMIVPPYPNGLTVAHGHCIGEHMTCDTSITIISAPPPPYWLDLQDVHILAKRNLGRDDSGETRWEVLDVVVPPAASDGYGLQAGLCRENGVHDETIVAMARGGSDDLDKESLDDVSWAIRLDRGTGTFLPLHPARVTCDMGM